MFDLAGIGSVAPQLVLCDDEEPQPRHRPRLLAFIREWTPESEPMVRRRLAQLDAELVVVSDSGAWSMMRGRDPEPCDRLDDEAEEVAAAYGVTAEGLFLIDQRNVLRFAYRPEGALGATLTEALDAAAEALQWRGHQSKLERVQWTPREWALKCLVVGCSLTFGSARPGDQRRFARGTGPIAKYESRELITPRADESALLPQLPDAGEWPSAPSQRRPS